MICCCELVDAFQSHPGVAIFFTRSIDIIIPASVKVNTAVDSALNGLALKKGVESL